MLINDTTFLLDEALDALKAIHETQEAMADSNQWSSQPQVQPPPPPPPPLHHLMSQELQQSRLHQLSEDERQCRSYLTLSSEVMTFFHLLTQEVSDLFMWTMKY